MRAFALCFLVLITLSTSPAQAATASVQELVASLPADATSVLAARVAAIRRSPFYQTMQDHMCPPGSCDMHMDEFSNATGIDPQRDLESFACSIDVAHKKAPTCLISGFFNSDQIARAADLAEAQLVADTQVQMWRFGEEHTSGDEVVVATPSEGLAVFGDIDGVRQVLSTLEGSAQSLSDSQLGELLGARHGDLFGVVSLGAVHELAEHQHGHLPAALSQIKHVSFDVGFDRDIQIDVILRGANGDDAELIRQSMLGYIATGKLSAQDNPELMALLSEIQVLRSGTDVELSTIVAEDVLSQLRDEIGLKHGHSRARQHKH